LFNFYQVTKSYVDTYSISNKKFENITYDLLADYTLNWILFQHRIFNSIESTSK